MPIKKITRIISTNKASIIRRALVLGGTVIGAILADDALKKAQGFTVEGVVVEEEVVETSENKPTEQ